MNFKGFFIIGTCIILGTQHIIHAKNNSSPQLIEIIKPAATAESEASNTEKVYKLKLLPNERTKLETHNLITKIQDIPGVFACKISKANTLIINYNEKTISHTKLLLALKSAGIPIHSEATHH